MSIYTITLKRELLSGGAASAEAEAEDDDHERRQANWLDDDEESQAAGERVYGSVRGQQPSSRRVAGEGASERESAGERQANREAAAASRSGSNDDSPAANEFTPSEADWLDCLCGLKTQQQQQRAQFEGANAGGNKDSKYCLVLPICLFSRRRRSSSSRRPHSSRHSRGWERPEPTHWRPMGRLVRSSRLAPIET